MILFLIILSLYLRLSVSIRGCSVFVVIREIRVSRPLPA
jgi:hypothetical protein